jgi:hypothetical protein
MHGELAYSQCDAEATQALDTSGMCNGRTTKVRNFTVPTVTREKKNMKPQEGCCIVQN